MYKDINALDTLWEHHGSSFFKGMGDSPYYMVSFANGEITDITHSFTNYDLLDKKIPEYLKEASYDPLTMGRSPLSRVIEDFFSTIFFVMTHGFETEGRVFTLHLEMDAYQHSYKVSLLNHDDEIVLVSRQSLLTYKG